MTLNRVLHMYGDKPALYAVSMCVFCFGMGYNVANFINWGNVKFVTASILTLIGVYFLDAIFKAVVWIKENFSVILTTK